MAECCAHPGVEAVRSCAVCGREFCATCFLTPEDQVCRFCRNRIASSNSTTIVSRTGVVGTQPPSPTSQMATVALILSILGYVCCCFGIFHIVALILAIVAKKELKNNPGMQGEGMATAAFWISIVGLILMAIGTVFYIVLGALGVLSK